MTEREQMAVNTVAMVAQTVADGMVDPVLPAGADRRPEVLAQAIALASATVLKLCNCSTNPAEALAFAIDGLLKAQAAMAARRPGSVRS